MRFWESQKLSYVIGFARNSRLQASIDLFVEKVMAEFHRTQEVQRQFTERLYQADTWDRPRRMIAKVGVTDLGLNRRFVVTHLTPHSPHPNTPSSANSKDDPRVSKKKRNKN